MPTDLPADDRLPKALLDAIGQRGGTRSFPANAILINEGDSTDSLYMFSPAGSRLTRAPTTGARSS
ncbi:MAG: hypothetical protein E6H65_02015 [Betaproteobacteria bacterium]|nr:MAG: hypothetical protein E6H65_02015 [Betaproteobacteria bacterium]